MDANKAEMLGRIGYERVEACGSCIYSNFSSSTTQFGECAINVYEHAKHSDSVRPLSILRYGVCPEHAQRVDYERQTEHFVF